MNHMKEPSRHIDREKVFLGVFLICVSVLVMLMELEKELPYWKGIWIGLLGLGLGFYLWGRFFSRGED